MMFDDTNSNKLGSGRCFRSRVSSRTQVDDGDLEGRGALSLSRQWGRSGRWSPLPWVESAGGTGPSLRERPAHSPARPFAHSPAPPPAPPPVRSPVRSPFRSPARPSNTVVRAARPLPQDPHRPLPLPSSQTSSRLLLKIEQNVALEPVQAGAAFHP